jgi:hypothetical protein
MTVGQRWFSGGFGREQVKPGFIKSASIYTVKIMGAFCYFSDFPDDVWTTGTNTGYDL